jgi:hypothetical protein
MPVPLLGIDCKAYLNTGVYATPVWEEVDCISDWSLTPGWAEGDASSRASPVQLTAKTQMTLEIGGKIQASLDGVSYLALNQAALSRTPLDMMILNGPKTQTGVTGFRADWHVFGGGQDQGLGAVLYDSVTLKPAASANIPKYVTVTAGAPVFSALPLS